MVLAGGGSSIKGLGALIERRLSDMGDVNAHVVDDPVRLGAMGGLRLAMEVPRDVEEPHARFSLRRFIQLLSSFGRSNALRIG